MTEPEDLARLLDRLRPGGTTVLSGAGISIPGPTHLPSGFELTRSALAWAFDPGVLERLRGVPASDGTPGYEGLYSRLDMPRDLPRLEVILGIASDAGNHGIAALEALLSPCREATPNALHRFLADHLDAGGSHLTANFDTCIERSGVSEQARNRIFHFHGSIDGPLDELGATLRRIQGGFSSDESEHMTQMIRGSEHLVVVGYSGSDFFDVAPLVASLASQGDEPLRGLSVIWVQHDGAHAPGIVEDHPSRISEWLWDETGPAAAERGDRPPEFRQWIAEEDIDHGFVMRTNLADAGAEVVVVRGPTDVVLDGLARRWNLRRPLLATSTERPEDPSPPLPSPEARTRSTAALWFAFGDTRTACQIMEDRADLFPLAVRAEAAVWRSWQRGKYRDAQSQWARLLPRSTPAERAKWDERQVACSWASGRYLTALLRVRRAWRRAIADDVVNPELAEQWGRILDHMARCPDLVWLSRFERPKAASAIRLSLEQPMSPTERMRVRSALRAITRDESEAGGETQTDARSTFAESESLIGILNFRHGRLRHESAEQPATRERLLAGQRWFLELGADGDARRVPFLPGAAASFSFGEVVRSAFGSQYGNLQRARLVAKWAVDRARSSRRGS